MILRNNVIIITTSVILILINSTKAGNWDSVIKSFYQNLSPQDYFDVECSTHRINPKWISQKDINLCIKQGKRFAMASENFDNIPSNNFQSPAFHLFFTASLSTEAKLANEHAKATLFSAKILQNKMNSCSRMTPNTFISFLEAQGFKNYLNERLPICSLIPTVRSLDGSCNNYLTPKWGAANTPYTRIAQSDYEDGLYSMPVATSGNPLPSPREIKNKLFYEQERRSQVVSNLAVNWGQLVAHDLSLRAMEQSATGGINCCSTDGRSKLSADESHSACEPITVPADDPFYRQHGVRCLNYVRTVTAPTIDGTFGPAQQMNTVSSFLDGSPIYSSRPAKITSLRTYRGGKLSTSPGNLLPLLSDPKEGCDVSGTNGCNSCYNAGDSRVNQTPSLAALQTLLAREHNRLAESLQSINPYWSDETLFQEARRILIAIIQHITYQEWLPLFIGKDYVRQKKISPIGLFSYDYNSNVNPGIINAFATGAFRFFHTLITSDFKMCPYENIEGGHLRLSDYYFKPGLIEMYENGLDAILRGSVKQSAMESDTNFSEEITNYLFKSINRTGLDLISMDIQRGRDHGLAKYNEYRCICGLRKAKNFEDLSGEIPFNRIVQLKSVYEHVDDIDLFVGGSLETDVYGSLLGPTFQCIIGEQFYRTRVGDSYFYDFGEMPNSFTREQLQEIKKSSMARLVCDNSNDINKIQLKAFERESIHNPIHNCYDTNKIPRINLQHWREF